MHSDNLDRNFLAHQSCMGEIINAVAGKHYTPACLGKELIKKKEVKLPAKFEVMEDV
jgi:hypothetical protein